MMDSLEIIASFDLDFVQYSKLNDLENDGL